MSEQKDGAQLAAEELWNKTPVGNGICFHQVYTLESLASLISKHCGETCHHTAIYYSKEHDNYYCSFCHKGMGVAFYELVTGLQKELATERVARKRLEANPAVAVGTCVICCATIWQSEEQMTNERGTFHPICGVIARAEAAESELTRLKEHHARFPVLDAKWLDPECHQGCKSLVFKGDMAKLREALAKVRSFVEYARYELDDGPLVIGYQFPTKDCADKELARIDAALASRSQSSFTASTDSSVPAASSSKPSPG